MDNQERGKMIKIKVYKSVRNTENAVISISKKVPNDLESIKDRGELFGIDAKAIYEILKNHLPHGVRHQLIELFLEEIKLTYFRKVKGGSL